MSWLGRRMRIATGKGRWVNVPVALVPVVALAIACGCYTACSTVSGALIGAAWAPGRASRITATDSVAASETETPHDTATVWPEATPTPFRSPTRAPTITRAAPSATVTPIATSTSAASPLVAGDEQAEWIDTEPTMTELEIEATDRAWTPGSAAPEETPAMLATETPPLEPSATMPASPLTPTQAIAGPYVRIVAVDKVAEWVNLRNDGDAAQDLAGWVLISEKGGETCPLGGAIQPGATLRVWARAQAGDLDGYHCGFGVPIWDDHEPDAAVLYDANGQRVDRFP